MSPFVDSSGRSRPAVRMAEPEGRDVLGSQVGHARDFAIVGAGPAGSRAAELLCGLGATVILLDPRAPWEKPCGGGLTAAALRNTPELAELDGQTQIIRELLVEAPSGASVTITLRTPFKTVSRHTLSRWGLDRACKAGAGFFPLAVRRAERERGGWRVTDSAGVSHRCRWLIAADGAASGLRGQLAPRLRPELAPLRVAYPSRGAPVARAMFRFLPAAAGYLWDFPRPDHHSVGIGVPPGTFARAAMDGAIEQYRLGDVGDSGAAEHRGGVIATSLWSHGGFEDLGGHDFALLGDAGGLADPATGEGIDYALRSAQLAVAAFQADVGFAHYPLLARAAFATEMRRARFVRQRLYRPWAAERLVRRAQRSPRAALLLASAVDAVNEHGSLGRALLRGLFSGIRPADSGAAECDCPPESDPHRPATLSLSRERLLERVR